MKTIIGYKGIALCALGALVLSACGGNSDKKEELVHLTLKRPLGMTLLGMNSFGQIP